MNYLRRSGQEGNATDHLGRLTLGQRSVQLLGGTVKAGKNAIRSGTSVVYGTAKVGKHTVEKASAVYRGLTTQEDPQEKARSLAKSSARTVGRFATRQVTGRIRNGHASIRAHRHSRAIARRSLTAGRNRTAVTSSARTIGASASRGSVMAARAVAAVSTIARVVVAAITTSLSSTPILIVIAVVVVVLTVVLAAVTWLIPGAQQQQTEESGTNLAGSFAMVDDYPYKGKYSENDPSPLGYAWGNCTDFVAWRVNRDAGVDKAPWQLTWSKLTPMGGNGADWGRGGNLAGWSITRTPVPGDIISIARAGVLGSSTSDIGHVAYVGAVDGAGVVTIENYGRGKYFLTTATIAQLGSWIDSGAVTIKHNPAGRIGGVPNGDANGDAKAYSLQALGGDTTQFGCLENLWAGESGWNPHAQNPSSGAYGIPQALPAEKLASAGADWRDNPITQVTWGLSYIQDRYGTPCGAWAFWQSNNPHWY